MLDSNTKRRIDTARDILVGKVPDPKSQVEQITIALIYKFMDDIDAESEEFGGKRSFFAGEFARYGWTKLMRAGLGGHETLNLYAEAITKMPENPGIPSLFRDIFNNAYLPYRDPETLRAFLKIIDEFTYDHSERLGDAFEYLLSVLGSQGDAGQFRTPRHIIDFIVAIIEPKKSETVLDPACGTAGFLISSYKYILAVNTDPQGVSTLTPDDKERLAANFKGYDISPDMVRLSLVNMYLHGFAAPRIFEYDTLTSEERWNDYADVILANPPFMSPKGGIRPHNRFSVQSKRSEVLFVDYMAEHLTPSGRAGIIVPEGIIFQSQNTYKQLRKMLVEEYLVAVVSLPAGVFNPYSGVKTSILILDKSLAKKTDRIAFLKIENDGFGLGAQRRPIDKNDIPQIQTAIGEYLRWLQAGIPLDGFRPALGLFVPKEKIGANGEYNLSGERYREEVVQSKHFPWRTVESLVETITPPFKIQKASFGSSGRFPIIDQSQDAIAGWTDDESTLVHPTKPLVIFGDHTCALKLIDAPFAQGADGIKILQTVDALDPLFLFRVLRARPLESSGYKRHYSKLRAHQIPLPPLEVQQEIVTEIEGYQKVIDGARVVVENYRPHIAVDPEWPMVPIGEHFTTMSGGTPSKRERAFWKGKIPWVSPKDMTEDFISDTEDHITEEAIEASSAKLIPSGSLACVVRSGVLKHSFPIAILTRDMCINQDLLAFTPRTGALLPKFVLYTLKTQTPTILQHGVKSGATVQSIHNGFFRTHQVPMPSLATQQSIVAEIEAEQALVNANLDLIARFEKKIVAVIGRVWGEAEPDTVEA